MNSARDSLTTRLSFPVSDWELESQHSGELLRLRKLLTATSDFRLIILEFNDPVYRDKLIQHIDGFPTRSARLVLDETINDFSDFEEALAKLCKEHDAVHVIGLETWLKDGKAEENRWKGFNYHREKLAELCPARLLLWMIGPDIKKFAIQSPDMWAWRTDVLDFSIKRVALTLAIDRELDLVSAPSAQRLQRVEEIKAYLKNTQAKDRRTAGLLWELGKIYKELGDWPDALKNLDIAAEIYRELNDQRSKAFVQSDIADVRFYQGRVDETLAIHRKNLKLFENLEDVRARAVTQGKIGDILQARGELDEALRIRREEELPVYERLGDVRARAVTLGKIGDILRSRGELDKALRIYREEELPVYERLGDLEGVTFAGIELGQLLCDMGQKEQALPILKRSLDGLLKFRRETEAQQLQALIDQIEGQGG